jgi:uncharacterized protein YkwD
MNKQFTIVTIVLVLISKTLSGQDWPIKDLDTGRKETYLSDDEKEIILLINKVRYNPALFAKTYLEDRKQNGPYAKECYNQLLTWKPQEILKPSKALAFAARDHAIDMGEKGAVGHKSTNGDDATARITRYGKFNGYFTGPWENCAYGQSKPLEIVLELLIDNDSESRGHRKNIMQRHIRLIGCSIKPHLLMSYNCVIDFADSIEEKN